MATRIFSEYGIDIFKTILGYKIVFEAAGHGGGLIERNISKADAERAMSSAEGAAEVLDRVA